MVDEPDDPLQAEWDNVLPMARRSRRASAEPPDLSGALIPFGQFISDVAPPNWLIEGIVQRGRLYACTSITGHGKTGVWLFFACMIAAGRDVGNLRTVKGKVVYLAGENPEDVKFRLLGMREHYGLPLDLPLHILPRNFPFTPEATEALAAEINALGDVALIVGDTAAAFFGGEEENSNVEMGDYARLLRSLTRCSGSPAVVTLAHPIKGASRLLLLPRGGGAFVNELDANLTLWLAGVVTTLHWCGKIRGPDFNPLAFKMLPVETGLIDQWGRPFQTVVAELMSEEAAADQAQQALANEDVVLASLRDHPGRGATAICRAVGWVDDGDRPERWKVGRALASLADDKLITKPRAGGPWKITEKGRSVLQGNEV